MVMPVWRRLVEFFYDPNDPVYVSRREHLRREDRHVVAAFARRAWRWMLGWIGTLATLTLAGVLALLIYAYLSGH
jgi:hypothetical protein